MRLMEVVVSRENMMAAYAPRGGQQGRAGRRRDDRRGPEGPTSRSTGRASKKTCWQVDTSRKPVRGVEIPKPGGGVRLLGIPTVVDRLIQQALHQVLMPLFDPGFSDALLRLSAGTERASRRSRPRALM